MVGGIYHRMQASHMKLCASRAFWLVAYPSQGHEMLFDAKRRFRRAAGWPCAWHTLCIRNHSFGQRILVVNLPSRALLQAR